MGRLLEKLKVKCRACGKKHIPSRISGKYLNGDDKGKRVHLWECKFCKSLWIDSADKDSTLVTGNT